jgi:hypothetical protein
MRSVRISTPGATPISLEQLTSHDVLEPPVEEEHPHSCFHACSTTLPSLLPSRLLPRPCPCTFPKLLPFKKCVMVIMAHCRAVCTINCIDHISSPTAHTSTLTVHTYSLIRPLTHHLAVGVDGAGDNEVPGFSGSPRPIHGANVCPGGDGLRRAAESRTQGLLSNLLTSCGTVSATFVRGGGYVSEQAPGQLRPPDSQHHCFTAAGGGPIHPSIHPLTVSPGRSTGCPVV